MRMVALAAVVASGILVSLSASEAAEIRLISSVGVRPAIEELLPQYERVSGHKVSVQFGTAAQMKAKIDAGEIFDVVILSPAHVDDLIKQGKGAADSRASVARAGMGLAIPADAPKPDIDTDEKLKTYLLGVKSIASGNPATGGFGSVFFDNLVQRLGIAHETRPKTKFSPPGEFAKAVAAGEAELGVGLISEIVAVKGVRSVPLMAGDPASFLSFAGVVASSTRDAEAARALLKFLTSPAAQDLFKAKGMTPS